jgi:long-chain acyl-CoA synthetase
VVLDQVPRRTDRARVRGGEGPTAAATVGPKIPVHRVAPGRTGRSRHHPTWPEGGAMSPTDEEASALIMGPGQLFELVDETVGGIDYRVFKHGPPTLGQLFAGARGDQSTFLVYEGERWSFEETMRHVDALAHALVNRFGINKGDRVGIAMRNLPEWIVSFAAIVSVGAISVSLNAWWTESEVEYAIDDAGLSLLIADPERIDRARRAAHERRIPMVVVRADEIGPTPTGVHRYGTIVTLGDRMPTVDVGPDDDATILYTSGTTGFPKGAVSTHRAIVQALMAFWARASVQRISKGDGHIAPDGSAPSFILIVPLFHVTGCVPVMLSCFGMKLKLVMMHRWDPEAALALIEAERVTAFVGVPTQSWDLLECPVFSSYDTSSLTSVGGGGAPAPVKLVDRVEKGFERGRPNIGYGMTETNAFGPGNSGDDYVSHPASTGLARTSILDIEIRDRSGRTVPAGCRGEIWMKGPNLIRGYWNKPAATAERIIDGWLASGDLGRIDGDGFLYIEDRANDMVLRAGENVYCAEVESAIYDHPDVYEAAVFGVPHERLGEEVACVIQVRSGSVVGDVDLRDFLAGRIALFKVPSRIVFTDEPLARNPSGKILKRALRGAYFDVGD